MKGTRKKYDAKFKAEEYTHVIRSLKKGKSIRDTAKLCDVSISTVQRVKREFVL